MPKLSNGAAIAFQESALRILVRELLQEAHGISGSVREKRQRYTKRDPDRRNAAGVPFHDSFLLSEIHHGPVRRSIPVESGPWPENFRVHAPSVQGQNG